MVEGALEELGELGLAEGVEVLVNEVDDVGLDGRDLQDLGEGFVRDTLSAEEGGVIWP